MAESSESAKRKGILRSKDSARFLTQVTVREREPEGKREIQGTLYDDGDTKDHA